MERNEIIDKFKNGRELDQKSVLFNLVVSQLCNGGDVFHLLEEVIVMQEELKQRHYDLVSSGTLRQEIILKKDQFERVVNEFDVTDE